MENKRHYKDVLLKKIDLVTFFGFTKPTLYTWQCDNGFEEKQKNPGDGLPWCGNDPTPRESIFSAT